MADLGIYLVLAKQAKTGQHEAAIVRAPAEWRPRAQLEQVARNQAFTRQAFTVELLGPSLSREFGIILEVFKESEK